MADDQLELRSHPSLPATSYAVLGMLSLTPMSGYDLNLNVGRSIAYFWQISKSQVYSELARLEDLGLVRSTEIEQERLPDKRTYEITDPGSRALDEWLSSPGHGPRRLRSGLLLKTFFAHRMPPDRFARLLDEYRTEAEEERRYLAEIVSRFDPELPESFYTRATALYGLRAADAALAWIAEIEATLPTALRASSTKTEPGAGGRRARTRKSASNRT